MQVKFYKLNSISNRIRPLSWSNSYQINTSSPVQFVTSIFKVSNNSLSNKSNTSSPTYSNHSYHPTQNRNNQNPSISHTAIYDLNECQSIVSDDPQINSSQYQHQGLYKPIFMTFLPYELYANEYLFIYCSRQYYQHFHLISMVCDHQNIHIPFFIHFYFFATL